MQAPTMAPAPTVAVAAAPAFAADTQIVAPAAAMPLSQSATEDAASHGAAPVSAPAGEAAPAVPVHHTQTDASLAVACPQMICLNIDPLKAA